MNPQIDYRQFSQAMLQMMASGQLGLGEKGLPSTTPTTYYNHGGTSTGLFSTLGLSQSVFSALELPRSGILERLNWLPTNETSPLIMSITGVSEDVGSEANGVCDDPPVAGLLYGCTQTFPLGRYSRMGRVYDIDRMGKVQRRGEFTDLQLVGNPNSHNSAPSNLNGVGNSEFNNEVTRNLFELGVSWQRMVTRQVYTGDPANNLAGGGYKEWKGLDLLINTGKVDAVDGSTLCPTLDSYVNSMASVDIAADPTGYVKRVVSTYKNIRARARYMGLDPVKIVIAMRWDMFYELTEQWINSYSTYRNATSVTQAQVTYDGFEMNRMRQEMRGDMSARTGQYLPIDGDLVEVVIDDGIAETQSAGSYTTSIYFIPLTILGGRQVTYAEYINYDMTNGAMEMANRLAVGGFFETSDNGRFLWHKKPPANFCVQWLAKMEPRLVMQTPQLAARMTNVKYTPFQHSDSPWTYEYNFTGGTNYGGISQRT